jgi:hypothetical protein
MTCMVSSSLNRGRSQFLNFLGAPMMEPPKNSKTTRDAYSGLDLTIHVNNILIYLTRQFLNRFLDIVRSHLGMRGCSGRSRRSDMSPGVAFIFISSEQINI